MTPETDRTRKALAYVVSEMPTAMAQAAIGRQYDEMRTAGESEAFIIRQLIIALADGLLYGNWPS